MLFDTFGRIHNYLRISLTDSCNFRCHYCMPDENMSCMSRAQLMQADEIIRLAEIFTGLGVQKIRLTGGEPLVRAEFPDILRRLSQLPAELTLSTNGALLHRHIELLKDCGVRSLNISIDSLKPEAFHRITARDQFQIVWDNIQLALQHGFGVKLNVVAMAGVNDDEIPAFVELTRRQPLHVRFIEFMPFTGNNWQSGQVLTAAEMLERVGREMDVVKLRDEPHATARKFKVIGYEGTFAFITTMSDQFCGECNRLRLTADGKLKNCLFGKEETDLLSALRLGEPVEPLIRESVLRKHAALGGQMSSDHQEVDASKIENRSMIKIGG